MHSLKATFYFFFSMFSRFKNIQLRHYIKHCFFRSEYLHPPPVNKLKKKEKKKLQRPPPPPKKKKQVKIHGYVFY